MDLTPTNKDFCGKIGELTVNLRFLKNHLKISLMYWTSKFTSYIFAELNRLYIFF